MVHMVQSERDNNQHIMGTGKRIEDPLLWKISEKVGGIGHRSHGVTDDGVRICNFSLSRQLFIDINECDEDFLDGSLEDNGLGIRVLTSGKIVRKSIENKEVICNHGLGTLELRKTAD
jgi:hypothetical protein